MALKLSSKSMEWISRSVLNCTATGLSTTQWTFLDTAMSFPDLYTEPRYLDSSF